MRKTLIAAAALMAVSTSAQAQVDHMNLTYPACVTPLHLDEADALWHAGKPVNTDVCIMLKEGTEVVRVSYQYPYSYMQIAYQVGGKTYTLFTNPSAMKGVIDEKKAAAERHRKKAEESDKKWWADHEEQKRARAADMDNFHAVNEEIRLLDTKYQRCVNEPTLGFDHPICKGLYKASEDKKREIFVIGRH